MAENTAQIFAWIRDVDLFEGCESGFLDNIMLTLFPRVYIKDEYIFEASPPARLTCLLHNTRMRAHPHMCAHTSMDALMHACTAHAHIQTHARMHTCAHTRTHASRHMHLHACTSRRMQRRRA